MQDWGPVPDEDLKLVWSRAFQWLPCEVEISKDDNTAKLVSYINNLHPLKHSMLYSAVEQVISKALPLWHIAWRYPQQSNTPRIKCTVAKRKWDLSENEGDPAEEWPEEWPEEWSEEWSEERYDEKYPAIKPDISDPGNTQQRPFAFSPEDLTAKGGLLDAAVNRLQIIVKLANVHLTPEKPEYPGGSWHVEGQLNEHICATALYYYDCDNITDSLLSFRTRVQHPENREYGYEGALTYEQDDFGPITTIFGAVNKEPQLQHRGDTLTREGRLLAFPNVWQHRVQPFRLVDPSRPGHRKILALFLVDPAVRVLSTANVPPQQKEWWAEQVQQVSGLAAKLPLELVQGVLDEVRDFPITLQEAKEIRAELIKERSVLSDRVENRVESFRWNFCEH